MKISIFSIVMSIVKAIDDVIITLLVFSVLITILVTSLEMTDIDTRMRC